jgi:xylulokinase
MINKYIIAHDMGTSADKAVLFTINGQIVSTEEQQYPMYHPKPGYAEQDPYDWWNAVCNTTKKVLKKTKIDPENIIGMTFSSQTQNFIPVGLDGIPLRRSMSWLDGPVDPSTNNGI